MPVNTDIEFYIGQVVPLEAGHQTYIPIIPQLGQLDHTNGIIFQVLVQYLIQITITNPFQLIHQRL